MIMTIVCSVLAMDVIEDSTKYKEVLKNLDNDLSYAHKEKLMNLFKEIEELKINDNYCARVFLKNESLFRYNLRRMSVQEKKEIDEIVDDLLRREIIKTSISPYCSRVVLVPKRNGKSRLYVDLRPLNQRIHQ